MAPNRAGNESKAQAAATGRKAGQQQTFDARLSVVDHFSLLQMLSVQTQDETCQLSQRPLALGSTSFVSETLIGATDLEDVMCRVARAYNVLHGGTFNRVESRSDRLVFKLNDAAFPFARLNGDASTIAIMEGVTICVHVMLSMVVADDLNPWLRTVHTRRPASARGHGGLLDYWQVPVRRGSNAYILEYSPRAGAIPVRPDLAPFTTNDVYEKILQSAHAISTQSGGTGLLSQVRQMLANGQTDQATVARKLGLSVATLRRRLCQHDADFRALRSETLANRAAQLLTNGWTIADVAETLGFSDARSFSRAFKGWFCLTPAQYRQK